jgi:hypothetical protein
MSATSSVRCSSRARRGRDEEERERADGDEEDEEDEKLSPHRQAGGGEMGRRGDVLNLSHDFLWAAICPVAPTEVDGG